MEDKRQKNPAKQMSKDRKEEGGTETIMTWCELNDFVLHFS